MMIVAISVAGCGAFGYSRASDITEHARAMREIAEQIRRYETGEIEPTPEELSRLREAVESHADAWEGKLITERIENLGAAAGALPHPGIKIGGMLLLLIAALVALAKKKKPILKR